jgi:DNA-binding winged helix-turn-helix (wHTH) protein
VIIRFAAFTLDDVRRQLLRDGTAIHLTPKAYDLLALLASEAPRVVGKVELHERLWPGTFVADATLVGLVKEVRRALDDHDSDRPLIRTVHRVGYAFAAPFERAAPAATSTASYWLVLKGERLALHPGENIVGRDPAAGVWLDAAGVSRRHARIVVDAAGAQIEDLGSKNGTMVDDAPVGAPMALQDGNRIAFGSTVTLFRSSTGGMSTETHARDVEHRGPHQFGPSKL